MRLGQLLSDTGYGMEIAQNIAGQARTERQNQLAIEEQNRVADLKKQLAGLQMPSFQPVDVAQFTQQFTPGQAMPMGAAPAPAAPPALRPGQQPLPAGVQPSQAGAGRGMVNPPMVGQPQPPDGAGAGRGFVNPPLIGQPQPQMSPQQLQRERDRIALLRGPTAALDVAQAPAAAGLNFVTMAGEQIINLGGRLVNAVTGADVAPTDVRGPRFSMTPFTDRFVREPEQALPQPPAAPAAPAAAAPAQPTKRAQSYDNKVTPYDAIMQQSAVQYGIDPVVFKRLLGSESSFNPTAVSPRGEKFGLGVAQIAAVHGLSREQMLNPNTAIPFAAQLFSQMVQQSGGNVEEALMRYKGATSAGGRAAMSKPIGDILSGLTPTATPAAAAPGAAAPEPFKPAATPAKTADAVVKAASFGTMYGSATGDASANNPQVQQVLTERQALVRQIQLMEQYGFGERAMQLVPQVRAIDLGLLKAQADQGIYEGTTTGNFSRAMAVLSNFRGQPHQSLDRGDGTHDLYVGGKLVRTGMPAEAMADFLRSNIDPAYQERKAAFVAEQAKRQAKIEEIVVDKVLTAKGNAEVATIQAMGRIAEEMEKRKGVKATHNTNNNTILVQETDNAGNTRVFLVDPTGTKTEMRGKVVESPQRTQIFGSR
jgi:hypothetical protein